MLAALVKTDALHKLSVRLGWQPTTAQLHYDEMVSFHQRIDTLLPVGATLFIGDSHTQGLATAAISQKSVNYGIGGDTTEGVLKRLRYYPSIANANAVVLAIGLNDLITLKPTDSIENFKRIFNQLPTSANVIVCAAMPVDERVSVSGERNNANIIELNRLLALLTEQYSNTTFLSTNDKLVNGQGQLSERFHVGDGVHLNMAGYSLWIADLRAALSS